ncbi:hypothetical protein E2C01_001715 [Portunus trituberculatus]|uniref:Uncharacterized protein n=1 Tax=Portunus trituberculatus TaxID=210409 RepID=A0A5B7CHD3_PORTR|nr:hypothetical protein [Portunus trituberculatus]
MNSSLPHKAPTRTKQMNTTLSLVPSSVRLQPRPDSSALPFLPSLYPSLPSTLCPFTPEVPSQRSHDQ